MRDSKLNKQQKQVVTHDSGPLLIVAGAGTGKTTVITERIKYLVTKKEVDPYSIFVTTFTEKASEELKIRLDQSMPFGYREPWVGTFHSLCERILRLEGLEIGINPSFTIMTATDQWLFLKQHLYELDLRYYRPLGNPTKFIQAMITFFGRLADEDISPDQFIHEVQQHQEELVAIDQAEYDRLHELAKVYQQYQQLKYEYKKVDFSDLINLTLKLFRDRPNVLHRYQKQFQHILIDEFQDTNIAQFELIKLLAPPKNNPNLIVVGDDNQSIYKFRGASISNILQFMDIYPQSQTIVLTNNYRSTQQILDASYQSIQQNNPDTLESKLHITKKLIPHTTEQINPEVVEFETNLDEVIWTVNKIVELVTKNGLTYKDIAILTRANSQLDLYVSTLKAAGIPYQRVSNSGLFDQEEVSGLIDFLHILSDPTDSIQLFKVAQNPWWKLDALYLLDLLNRAKNQGTDLWSLFQQEETTQKCVSFINQYRQMSTNSSARDLLTSFIEEVQYIKPLIETESIENTLKLKNINLFFNKLKQYESQVKDNNLITFLEILDEWIEAGENPGQAQIEDIDTVSLMTVHSAKGLEFPAVFVGSLLAGRFPSNNRKDSIILPDLFVKETMNSGDVHLQEERRLFYVALTRAKTFLYLTYAKDMGGVKKWKPSGFISETGLNVALPAKEESNITMSTTKPIVPSYITDGKYRIDKVSFTQVDTFTACPLRYKFKYLLKLPTKETGAAGYGNAVHQTLQAFEQQRLHGTLLSEKELVELFLTNTAEVTFINKEQKKARIEQGIKAIKQYYQQKDTLLGTPKELEVSFKIKLDTGVLVGKIDRIDLLPNGEYAILDYKTSDVKPQPKVDKDEQLSIYALAVEEIFHLPVDTLGLYFFDHAELVTTTRTPKQIAATKAKLNKRLLQMQQSDFPAKPDVSKCNWCEFNKICPFSATKK